MVILLHGGTNEMKRLSIDHQIKRAHGAYRYQGIGILSINVKKLSARISEQREKD